MSPVGPVVCTSARGITMSIVCSFGCVGLTSCWALRVGTAVAQWLRCCATNRKVAGSIPAGAIGIFH